MFSIVSVLALLILSTPIFPAEESCHARTSNEAVLEVARSAWQKSQATQYEWGGLVYRLASGKVCASLPVTSYNPTRFLITLAIPAKAVLLAVYHTHIGTTVKSHTFSGTDALNACIINVPSFLIAGDGVIMKLVPSNRICGDHESFEYFGEWVGYVDPDLIPDEHLLSTP